MAAGTPAQVTQQNTPSLRTRLPENTCVTDNNGEGGGGHEGGSVHGGVALGVLDDRPRKSPGGPSGSRGGVLHVGHGVDGVPPERGPPPTQPRELRVQPDVPPGLLPVHGPGVRGRRRRLLLPVGPTVLLCGSRGRPMHVVWNLRRRPQREFISFSSSTTRQPTNIAGPPRPQQFSAGAQQRPMRWMR